MRAGSRLIVETTWTTLRLRRHLRRRGRAQVTHLPGDDPERTSDGHGLGAMDGARRAARKPAAGTRARRGGDRGPDDPRRGRRGALGPLPRRGADARGGRTRPPRVGVAGGIPAGLASGPDDRDRALPRADRHRLGALPDLPGPMGRFEPGLLALRPQAGCLSHVVPPLRLRASPVDRQRRPSRGHALEGAQAPTRRRASDSRDRTRHKKT